MSLDLTYRQPRLLLLGFVVVLVAGLSALATAGRQEDPTITNLFAMIRTPYPGAQARDVEELLTIPIEERLRRISEIETIESTSSADLSVVVVELSADIAADRIEDVWAEIRDDLEDARPTYPTGAGPSEIDTDFTGTFSAIVAVSAVREGIPPAIAGRYARGLALRLQEVPGTRDVRLFGQREEEVRVEIAPAELAGLGMTVAEVARAIAASDGRTGAGRVVTGSVNAQLGAEGEVGTMQDLRDLDIPAADGRTLKLGSVAEIARGVRTPARTLALHDGGEAVLVAVRLEDGRRIDRWMETIRSEIDAHRRAAPEGLRIELVFDQGTYTAERLAAVGWNLALGLVLVVLVLLASMGLRAALVVGSTIPLVGLATIASLDWVGIPLHQMSITGLIVALGLVVDANIVMVDEVMRRRADGQAAAAAVAGAVRRLAAPLTASMLTTAFAFMPMLLLPGAPGDFISTIAVAVILMLFWSFLIALVLTAGLAGRALRDRPAEAPPPRDGGAFAALLGSALARPRLALPVVLSPALLGFALASTLPAQFFPGVDRDQFQVEIHMAPGTPIARTEAAARAVGAELLSHPEVRGVTWTVGRGVPVFYYNVISQEGSTPHYAQAMVLTRSPEATLEVLRKVQDTLGRDRPGAQVVVRRLVQGPPVTAPVEVRLYGQDVDALRRTGEAIRATMIDVPGVVGTRATLSGGAPTIELRIDDARAASVGLERGEVARQIADAIDGRIGGTIQEGEEQVPIRVAVGPGARSSIGAISDLSLFPPGPRAGPPSAVAGVPLSAVATLDLVPGGDALGRRNGDRINVVQAFTAAEVLPQEVEAEMHRRLAAAGFAPPPGITVQAGGDSDARDETMRDLQASFALIVVLAVTTVILTFGSFRLAAISGLVCVLSVGSSLLSLALLGQPMGIMASVGIIGAVGVSINAAIIVITALQADEHACGRNPGAIVRVTARSLRHIASTTITTSAGFLPLIAGGGGFWPPFAIAMSGGVLLSAFVSLFVTPILFALLWASPGRAVSFRLQRMAEGKPS